MKFLYPVAVLALIAAFAVPVARPHEAPQPQQQQVPQPAPTTSLPYGTIQNVFGGAAVGECPASNPNVRLMFDYTVPVICTGQVSACPGRLVCNKDGNKTCSFIPGECNVCTVPQRRYVCLNDEQLKEAEK